MSTNPDFEKALIASTIYGIRRLRLKDATYPYGEPL